MARKFTFWTFMLYTSMFYLLFFIVFSVFMPCSCYEERIPKTSPLLNSSNSQEGEQELPSPYDIEFK